MKTKQLNRKSGLAGNTRKHNSKPAQDYKHTETREQAKESNKQGRWDKLNVKKGHEIDPNGGVRFVVKVSCVFRLFHSKVIFS